MDSQLEQAIAAATTIVIGAVVASLLVPFAIRIAEVLDAIDHPNERKRQKTAVPRLGGIAIFAAMTISAGGVSLAMKYDLSGASQATPTLSIMLATGLIFLLGLVDDVVGASVLQKLGVQVAAAVLLIRAGVVIDSVEIAPFGTIQLGLWGALISIIWVVGVTNAINLLDGLDGLASGVVAIIALSFTIFLLLHGDRALTVVFSAGIVGACLGFLRHNWSPARVFMGDSGSLTLGFLMAALSIQSAIKGFATVAILVPILALGLPVVDTLIVMLVRFTRRGSGHFGKRVAGMFRPDREHFHHVLERVFADRKRIVICIYSMVFAFCAFGLVVAATKNDRLGISLLVLELLVVLGVRGLVALQARSLSPVENPQPANVQEFSQTPMAAAHLESAGEGQSQIGA